MPATTIMCPDGVSHPIEKCLANKGCRLYERCAPLPYLRLISFDRKFRGVTPSASGNGPLMIGLKATLPYTIDPDNRAFAALGTTVHGRMADKGLTFNVLSEETLSDDQSRGIADLLEKDEYAESGYLLTDYKTSGSFAVAKWLGIFVEKRDVPIKDDKGQEVLLKSGKNKGKVKTKQERLIKQSDDHIKKHEIVLQLNRYRIFFEKNGFPINKMRAYAIPRDGGTYIAKNRGILRNGYFIPVPRLPDNEVLSYYSTLQNEVDEFLKTGKARLCNEWETWGGNRCLNYCEIAEDCKDICREDGLKWPGDNKVPK